MDDMRNHFDTARQRPPEQDLEELRQNYFIQATMQGGDDPSIGGLRVNVSGRKNEFAAGSGKAKRSTLADDLLFLDMLEQKYGEYFAENWAAELLDEETYSELMKIEDQAERGKQSSQRFAGWFPGGKQRHLGLQTIDRLGACPVHQLLGIY